MMMDDIFFNDPAECAECHKKYESGTMVWLKGRYICPECYERRKPMIVELHTNNITDEHDREAWEEDMRRDAENYMDSLTDQEEKE